MDQTGSGNQTQRPNMQPQMQIVSVKKISWSKVIITIFVIIVVTAIISGVYWFFILNKSSEDSDLTGPVPKPQVTTTTPSATPSVQEDKTADWKVYKSSADRYSTKYPTNFNLTEDKLSFKGKTVVTFKSSDFEQDVIESCGPQPVTKGGYLRVNVDHFSGNINTLNQIVTFEIENIWSDFTKVEKFPTTLGGREATRMVYFNSQENSNCQLTSSETMERIFVINDNGVDYLIEMRYMKKDKEDLTKIFNQILSTFKFLD